MEFRCPDCGVKGYVPDERLPAEKASLRCPQCGNVFKVRTVAEERPQKTAAPATGSCAGCGRTVLPGATRCQYCGYDLVTNTPAKALHAQRVAEAPPQTATGPMRRFTPVFTGTAGQFFRIWIVNTVLTVLTLGVYLPWAKVRNRQYLYAHTELDGHPFEYTAKPLPILKGYAIIFLLLLIYYVLQYTLPAFTGVAVLLFFGAFPFLVYKSHQFKARYSAFRNIRFHFHGTLGRSYLIYLLLPIGNILSLGTLVPYYELRRREYFYGNMAYGTARNEFSGSVKYAYRTYFVLFALLALFAVAGFALSFSGGFLQQGGDVSIGLFSLLSLGVLFLLFAGASVFSKQFIHARMTNHCFNESSMGPITFENRLRSWPLTMIQMTNILAVTLSFGLLIPWAKIRRLRYVLSCLTVECRGGLDAFAAAQEKDVSAVGDAAADIFDLDIGL